MYSLCKKIDKRLNTLKHNSNYLLSFYDEIEKFNPIIIGGFIRNSINDEYSRDIDIILNFHDSSVIEKIIKKYNLVYKKNSFNGYKIFIDNIVVDIWSIDNHYLFQKGVYEQKVENLIETTFINYDFLIYDLKNKKLDIKYYLEFLNTNTIDFVGSKKAIESNKQIYLSILKIFNTCHNKNAKISKDVQEYILEYYYKNKDSFMLELNNEHLRHYNCYMSNELEQYIINFFINNKHKVLSKEI